MYGVLCLLALTGSAGSVEDTGLSDVAPLALVFPAAHAGSARAGIDHGPDLRLGGLQTEESDRPSQARLLPRPQVGVRGKLRDQVKQAVRARFSDLGG